MLRFLINLLIAGAAVFLSAYLLPGVTVDSFVTALIAAVVLGLVNAFIKPFIMLLTLPINVLTLGLLGIIINALMVLLVDMVVPGFTVDGFLWAIIFGVVLAIVNGILGALAGED